MELEAMAQPMTPREWRAHLAANQWTAQGSEFVKSGNLREAARCYDTASQVPGLRVSSRVALLLMAAELMFDLLREMRGEGRPTLH